MKPKTNELLLWSVFGAHLVVRMLFPYSIRGSSKQLQYECFGIRCLAKQVRNGIWNITFVFGTDENEQLICEIR